MVTAFKVDQPTARRVDEVSSTVTYIGDAAPGSIESASVWRIQKITFGSGATEGDITIEWADGDLLFDNDWSQRLTLSYS